tara:strand:- start:7555 stop:8007 length:453 start_codon:yes stop_codon:yes gene_type:complete
MITIGIDPGKSGGIAIIKEEGIIAKSTPKEATGMARILRNVQNEAHIDSENINIFIENVHAFPTDSRSGAFKFGTNFGLWLGILGAYNLDYERVSPRKWMSDFAPLPKIKKERKTMLKQIAQDMFPDIKVTYKVSDAILIAVWGVNNGTS